MNDRRNQVAISTSAAKIDCQTGIKATYAWFVCDIVMATLLTLALALFMDVPRPVLLQGLVVFGFIVIGIVAMQRQLTVAPNFGPADRVTLVRSAIAAFCAGLLLQGGSALALEWWLPAIAAVALALDGIDGWLARRTGTASEFGARFDMEIDAFFILVLSALVWQLYKTGPWVLAIGAMRYAFLAAAVFVPRLEAPLFKSRRRQTVCVIQVAALVICLIPLIGPGIALPVAATALLALCYSFAIDIIWLLKRDDRQPRPYHNDNNG